MLDKVNAWEASAKADLTLTLTEPRITLLDDALTPMMLHFVLLEWVSKICFANLDLPTSPSVQQALLPSLSCAVDKKPVGQ